MEKITDKEIKECMHAYMHAYLKAMRNFLDQNGKTPSTYLAILPTYLAVLIDESCATLIFMGLPKEEGLEMFNIAWDQVQEQIKSILSTEEKYEKK